MIRPTPLELCGLLRAIGDGDARFDQWHQREFGHILAHGRLDEGGHPGLRPATRVGAHRQPKGAP
jgi:hypothetical protein